MAIRGAENVTSIAKGVIEEVGRAYMGPSETIEVLLVALLAKGHVLVEGVPGIAKTTLVKAFSRVLGCSFKRVQFTPDLLPSDITGTYVLDMRTNTFVLREGPIFAHVILGDEINRAPAKTQAALLEAMQEKQVTIDGETRPLPAPFMVLATQNPLEHEGTYRLPEAQVDRFLLKLPLDYPSLTDEKRMLAAYSGPIDAPDAVLAPKDILAIQELAQRVHVEDSIIEYVLALAAFTRNHPRIYVGASPRAALALLCASKARALLRGREFVLPDDAKALAPNVLAHRLILTPEAELDGNSASDLVCQALMEVRCVKG